MQNHDGFKVDEKRFVNLLRLIAYKKMMLGFVNDQGTFTCNRRMDATGGVGALFVEP